MITSADPSVTRKEYLAALGVILVMLLISVWLQVQVSPSPMTLGEDVWAAKLAMHLEDYPFSIRPLQSYSTLWLQELTGLPVRESFFAVQFTLTLLLGFAFYRLMRQLAFSSNWSLVGLFLLMTAYPIFGAHWAPTHTWDDIWAYLFLVLAVSATLKKQPIWSAVWLIGALLSREPVIVFYPIIAWWLWRHREELRPPRLVFSLILPPLFFVAVRLLFSQDMDLWRWPVTLMGNFLTPDRRTDTVVSATIAFGPLWLLSLAGLIPALRDQTRSDRNWLAWMWLITVPLTVGLTCAGALVRETRILFPPFVCVIPLSVIALQQIVDTVRSTLNNAQRLIWAVLLAACIAFGVTAANLYLFPTFHYTTNEQIRRPLAGLHLGALVAVGAFLLTRRATRPE